MINLLRAEWIKFASLRSSWTRLGMAFVINGLFVGFALWAFDRTTGDSVPDTSIAARVDVLSAGITLASLVFIVVGIAIFTNEIDSKSIIPTAVASPDRTNLASAKALLTLLVGLVAAAVMMAITALVVFAVLDQRGFPLALDDDDVARTIFGAIAYFAIAALFGLGVGVLTNSSTTARAIGLLWPIAAEPAFKGFLPDWIDRVLPFEAGSALVQTGGDHALPAAEGGGVFLAWSALLVIAGWAIFNRRDLSNS
jgi:ABC-2 type transport system permease protein